MKLNECKTLQHKMLEFLGLRRHSDRTVKALPTNLVMFVSCPPPLLLFTTTRHLYQTTVKNSPLFKVAAADQICTYLPCSCCGDSVRHQGCFPSAFLRTLFGQGHNKNSAGQPCCWVLTLGSAPRPGLRFNPACPATAHWGHFSSFGTNTTWKCWEIQLGHIW